MKNLLLLLAITLNACGTKKKDGKEEKVEVVKTYTITCKLPLSGIKKYEVNRVNFDMPSNYRGGLWIFHTVNGLDVRSTFCHTEGF